MPIPDEPRPTLRALRLCRLVECRSLLQNGAILTAMALARGDEFQATVTVDFIVPMLKPRHPLTRLADGIEGLVGKAGMIFQCLKLCTRFQYQVTNTALTPQKPASHSRTGNPLWSALDLGLIIRHIQQCSTHSIQHNHVISDLKIRNIDCSVPSRYIVISKKEILSNYIAYLLVGAFACCFGTTASPATVFAGDTVHRTQARPVVFDNDADFDDTVALAALAELHIIGWIDL